MEVWVWIGNFVRKLEKKDVSTSLQKKDIRVKLNYYVEGEDRILWNDEEESWVSGCVCVPTVPSIDGFSGVQFSVLNW